MGETDGTPLMRQYRDIKQAYRDAILFFRVGDFYEMFQEDAVEASKLLSIALTSRDKSSDTPIPLCGVPYHGPRVISRNCYVQAEPWPCANKWKTPNCPKAWCAGKLSGSTRPAP